MTRTAPTTTVFRTWPWLGCYAVSGFCLLTLEMLWMRAVALRAGNTVVAATLVISTFFLAAALGNLAGAWWCRRHPATLRWYGWCELLAGLTALGTFALDRAWAGHHDAGVSASTVAIAATVLLVALPAFFSGASLPQLMERFVPGDSERANRGGLFYGINLIGAAMGVAIGGVLLPWWFGMAGAFLVVTLLQTAQGAVAWKLAAHTEEQTEKPSAKPKSTPPVSAWSWIVPALSGLLSLGVQGFLLVWARQILPGSIYAVSAVLAAFLAGLGLGSFTAGFLRRRGMSAPTALALFAGLSAFLLFLVPVAGEILAQNEIDWRGSTPAALLGISLFWGGLSLLPLTLCLGAILPLAWELTQGGAAHEGTIAGATIALNKLGSALGLAAASFILLPMLGLTRGLDVIAWGYAAIALAMLLRSGAATRRGLAMGLAVVAAVGIWQTARTPEPLGVHADERALATACGPYGTVTVIENLDTNSHQILLNSQQRLSGTERALSSQHHQSWVPLLFCRQPERVLTIGMASGISADAALDFPIKQLIAVELVPEVIRAARDHFAPWNARLFTDPRATVMAGDGRVVLNRLPGKFDAILCDLFFPQEEGTATLYSRDFFLNARNRLTPQGVFCLWLPCYQHSPETAGIIVRTFLDVFPNAVLVRSNLDPLQPVLGLLGSNQPLPFSRAHLAAQLATPTGRVLAEKSPFFRSPEHAWLLLAGDLHAAEPGFENSPLTTDDRPQFLYLGGCFTPSREALVGMPFLNWMGRRFLRPLYPSCELDGTAPEEILRSVRAANYYYAAAVAQSVIPGDTRPEAFRNGQTLRYLQQAEALNPQVHFPVESLGK